MIPFSDEKLLKYFSNELSEEEVIDIDNWKSASSENEVELNLLESSFNIINTDSFRVKKMPKPDWEAFEEKYINGNDEKTSRKSYTKYYMVAASLLIAVYSFFMNQAPSLNVFETQFGETKLVTLPDGSKVRLNYKSKLEFGEFINTRTVKLIGEGYFEVMRDESRPFIIETSVAKTTVLGTKFNLKSRVNGTELVVTEGKVAFESLKDNSNSKILIKNQKCDILADGTISEVKDVNSNINVSWLKKRLIFRNELLSKVVTELEHIYNKKIKIDETVQPVYVSAVLHYEKPLEEVLNQLCASFNLSFSKENEHFLIK